MTDTKDSKYTRQTVTGVHTWVPQKLFSLRVTRNENYAFQAGQFARVGLPGPDAPDGPPTLWRAYSMVSAPHEPHLEFYSVVVTDGQFSPRLAMLKPGDSLYIEKNPYGFLTTERFAQGGNLWLLASATGLSTYISMLRDPTTWQAFQRIILVHGVRTADELAYRDEIESWSRHTDFAHYFADDARKLIYLPIATRGTLPGMPQARLTTLLADGALEKLAAETLNPAQSKIMLCGNPDMLTEARKLLAERGFVPGRRSTPGNLAVENYW